MFPYGLKFSKPAEFMNGGGKLLFPVDAAYDITTRVDTQGGILIFFNFFSTGEMPYAHMYYAHIGIMIRAYTKVFGNCQ